jgi:hypothetical protein
MEEKIKNASKILVENLKQREKPVRPRRRWETNIKMDTKYGGRVWTGFIYLRIGTSGGLL